MKEGEWVLECAERTDVPVLLKENLISRGMNMIERGQLV